MRCSRKEKLSKNTHGMLAERGSIRGFSMIEVLVAIIVLSLGLLGMAAMQGLALKNSYASYQRAIANLQAQDGVERLWSSRCVLGAGSVLKTVESEWIFSQKTAEAKLAMPDWSGSIVQGVTPGTYSIAISWTERSNQLGQEGAKQMYTHTVGIPFQNCL